jgi:methionine synthase II (cobalamin-independent)
MNTDTPRINEWEIDLDNLPLAAALSFADEGSTTGGLLTHSALKILAAGCRELNTARAEIEAIMETLKSPIEVELDMIRGKIAIPDRSELDYIKQIKTITERLKVSDEEFYKYHGLWDCATKKLETVTEQRDRLAELVKKIRAGYGGQLVDPDCDCSDCEFLRPIDEALQSLTTNEL